MQGRGGAEQLQRRESDDTVPALARYRCTAFAIVVAPPQVVPWTPTTAGAQAFCSSALPSSAPHRKAGAASPQHARVLTGMIEAVGVALSLGFARASLSLCAAEKFISSHAV